MGLYESLHESIKKSPVIWKGDYPYFIHAITDGVPRLEPEVLEDVLSGVNEVTDWNEIDLIIGIEAMGLPLVRHVLAVFPLNSPQSKLYYWRLFQKLARLIRPIRQARVLIL